MNVRNRKAICIVTPGYISSTPRVVREADALAAAGYRVRVVFSQGQLEQIRAFDQATLQNKRWQSAIVQWSNARPTEWWTYQRTRIRHFVARQLPPVFWNMSGVLERAEGRVFPEMAALAAAEPADLYIGHYPDGLAAASLAARRHRAASGYDIEDLYADTEPPDAGNPVPRARVVAIEKQYVGACSYVSVVSEPLGQIFTERYGRRPDITLHNCHPWADRNAADGQTLDRRGSALSLYWYSQTIGLNRGIQDAIRAAGLLSTPIQVHLRGAIDENTRSALLALARESGVPDAVHFHAQEPPDRLLSRAMEHDVGLALEQGHSLNNRMTASNKLFLYMTAGLALAATDTEGQRSVLQTCPGAGVLYAAGDVQALAAHLRTWVADRPRLDAARQAGLDAARTRWSLELETQKLVHAIDRLFGLDAQRVAS